MFIGGRNSEGFISWNAYPDAPNGNARFLYPGTKASQIVYPNWANQMQFKFSSNTPVYGQPVTWSTTMVLTQTGQVGIGTTNPLHRLHLQGGDMGIYNSGGALNFKVQSDGFVWARQLEVLATPIPDYVFDPEYPLMPLGELKLYISENHHLPRIKSAEEYAATGSVNVGELQVQLLEKVEELTLYILTLKEEIDHLKTNLPSTNPSSTHEKP